MPESGEGGPKITRRSFVDKLLKVAAGAAVAVGVGKLYEKSDERILASIPQKTPEPTATPPENKDPYLELMEKFNKAEERRKELEEAVNNKFTGNMVGVRASVSFANGEKHHLAEGFQVTAPIGLFVRSSPIVPDDPESNKIEYLVDKSSAQEVNVKGIDNGKTVQGVQFFVNYEKDGKAWSWAAIRPQELRNHSFLEVGSSESLKAGDREYVFFCAREGNDSYVSPANTTPLELD